MTFLAQASGSHGLDWVIEWAERRVTQENCTYQIVQPTYGTFRAVRADEQWPLDEIVMLICPPRKGVRI